MIRRTAAITVFVLALGQDLVVADVAGSSARGIQVPSSSRSGTQTLLGDPNPWIPVGYVAVAPVGSTSIGNKMVFTATEKAPGFAPDVALCVSPPPNSCSSSTSCIFQGLQNIALGSATLSLVGPNLLVSNVGGSGNDGVRVVNSGSPATSIFRLEFTHVSSPPFPGLFVEILPSFPVDGPVTMRYEAFLNNVSVAGPTLSSLPVHASDWPDSQNFVLVNWAHTISIALPGGSPVTANELEIIPQTPTFTGAAFMEYRGTSSGGSSLTSLTITAESFGGLCASAMTGVGSAALVALLLFAFVWSIFRRVPL